MTQTLIIRSLAQIDYSTAWEAMQRFTALRTPEQADEIWLIEHPPVFTLGQNGKKEHILDPGTIPVISVDRGGQVTYHGPGQLVLYVLLDLRRQHLGVRALVTLLEQSMVALLSRYGVEAYARCDAPGVYVQGAKIGSIGLRIRRGCSYHGLSLNVNMDLSVFSRINPCGYTQLAVTQLTDWGINLSLSEAAALLIDSIRARLSYTEHHLLPHSFHSN